MSSFASKNPAFSNPALRELDYDFGRTRHGLMTVQGTVGKTAVLLALLSATAIWSWNAMVDRQFQPGVLGVAAIGTFIVAMITAFKPTLAPWTAPLYAAFEGLLLGAISYIVEHSFRGGYPGIALQAVMLTVGTLAVMLGLYGTRVVRVTDKLRTGIMAATGALCLFYLVVWVLRLFGVNVGMMYAPTPLGIGISLVAVGLAAFNLLLDFDFIENASRAGAPRSMEWYGAFGLLVTLVWLYVEILRLLSLLSRRDD